MQFPENYRWSSYRGYIGLDEYTWLQTKRVLRLFDLSGQNAINSFMEQKGLNKSIEQLAKLQQKNSGTLSRLASRVENQPELITFINGYNYFHH